MNVGELSAPGPERERSASLTRPDARGDGRFRGRARGDIQRDRGAGPGRDRLPGQWLAGPLPYHVVAAEPQAELVVLRGHDGYVNAVCTIPARGRTLLASVGSRTQLARRLAGPG